MDYYFTHDQNARHDPKHRALIKKYGMEGYGRFWVIIEMLNEENTHKLQDEDFVWDALAEQMQCDVKEVKSFIKDCVEKFKLFIQDNGFFYSESLLKRISKLEAMRDKNRNAAYIMHEKYGHNITKDRHEPKD